MATRLTRNTVAQTSPHHHLTVASKEDVNSGQALATDRLERLDRQSPDTIGQLRAYLGRHVKINLFLG